MHPRLYILAMYIVQIAQLVGALLGQHIVQKSEVLTGLNDVQSVSLMIPVSMPLYSERLDPQLVALSIEADRWPDWAGYEVHKPNLYTKQLLANLESKIGMPPAIRVGGMTPSFC